MNETKNASLRQWRSRRGSIYYVILGFVLDISVGFVHSFAYVYGTSMVRVMNGEWAQNRWNCPIVMLMGKNVEYPKRRNQNIRKKLANGSAPISYGGGGRWAGISICYHQKGETQWQFTQVKNNKNERTNPFNSIFPSFDVSHLIHHSA